MNEQLAFMKENLYIFEKTDLFNHFDQYLQNVKQKPKNQVYQKYLRYYMICQKFQLDFLGCIQKIQHLYCNESYSLQELIDYIKKETNQILNKPQLLYDFKLQGIKNFQQVVKETRMKNPHLAELEKARFKKMWSDDKKRKEIIDARKKTYRTKEYREKRSDISKKMMENQEIKNKMQKTLKKTMLEKYGVENCMHIPEVIDKQQKSAKAGKNILFRETENWVQGFEHFALHELENRYPNDEIIIHPKIKISYCQSDGTIHYYFPDIFIPIDNLLIEVKSLWTLKSHYDQFLQKQQACLKLGYNFLLMIYNQKGELLNNEKELNKIETERSSLSNN